MRNNTRKIIKTNKIHDEIPKFFKTIKKKNYTTLLNVLMNKINNQKNIFYDGSSIIYKKEYIGKILRFNTNKTYCIKIEDYCYWWFKFGTKKINNVSSTEIKLLNEEDKINLLCRRYNQTMRLNQQVTCAMHEVHKKQNHQLCLLMQNRRSELKFYQHQDSSSSSQSISSDDDDDDNDNDNT